MEIWFWRYELQPLASLNAKTGAAPRQGALLRVGGGFADLHPWPELDDAPLERQLELLARGHQTPLTAAALRLARLDATARQKRVSLFDGLSIPPSHFTVPDISSPIDVDEIADAGFDTIKIKMGRDLSAETAHLMPLLRQSRLKVRIDFNESLDERQAEAFLRSLPKQQIDFLEDPLPYDSSVWSTLSARYGVRFAADRPEPNMLQGGVAVLVFKPALRDEQAVLAKARRLDAELIVTSNMDHPVGQIGAAAVAARLASRVGVCGLITHTLYASNEFSARIRCRGPRLEPPQGTGIGFDDLLEKLPWRRLT